MFWKDTESNCKFFRYEYLVNWRSHGIVNDPFYDASRWYDDVITNGTNIYPNQDLSNISKQKVTSVGSKSTLFFDQSSKFPRFKLGLTDNKRCIKIPKADYIVVSGDANVRTSDKYYVVIEDSNTMYFVLQDEWDTWFGGRLSDFETQLLGYHNFTSDAKVIYKGKIQSYTKDSLYLAKYVNGEYTVPFITDNDLDKLCCNMCPEPTYEEFLSIIDMLNSDDASIVQLGIKMLVGYNVEKYKLSFRLILQTRANWYTYCRNLVACKQLMETLGINQYYINDSFSYGSSHCQKAGETYTAEDVAIAKKLAYMFIKEDIQRYANNNYFNNSFIWLPDERTIKLE